MYPYLRMAYHLAQAVRAPKLGVFDTHVLHTRIWPQDIDPWMELNNGRTLTLYDLGRLTMFQRSGITGLMRQQGWGATVAGSFVRYRRRVTLGTKVEIRSRVAGFDDRFVYILHSMWANGNCTSHMLLRSALIENRRLMPTARAIEAMEAAGLTVEAPELPGWIQAWIEAEAARPWPPED